MLIRPPLCWYEQIEIAHINIKVAFFFAHQFFLLSNFYFLQKLWNHTVETNITKLFLTDSGEGDESLRRRDRSAEEEVERGLYPSDDGEAADGSGDDNGEADSSGREEAEVRSMHMYIN